VNYPIFKRGIFVQLGQFDECIASWALGMMTIIPLVEIVLRPLFGSGVQNSSVLVQHLGLVLAMYGALAAERHGHLSTLGNGLARMGGARLQHAIKAFANGSAAVICGILTLAGWHFVATEMVASHTLAYGVPTWCVQVTLPIAYALLGMKLGARCSSTVWIKPVCSLALTMAGFWLASAFEGIQINLWPGVAWLLAILLCGAPIFAVLGGLALVLFWQDGQPLASVVLSHYQITVNPSLPALPLFTLAGLIFARTGAASRLSAVFLAVFGSGSSGTILAAAVLCSFFTAFTGGSGVTILALGGLLLPLLTKAGVPEQRGISLVTSASALGVLLAPSVPLIMYAIIARVPINTMFLAGIVPACVMVLFLLGIGGYLKRSRHSVLPSSTEADIFGRQRLFDAIWIAKFEILAPVIAIGSLVSGMATPTESAALTVTYATVTQFVVHRDLSVSTFGKCLRDCTQIVGGVMLILGMALGLTNYLVDSGIPSDAIDWVQGYIPNKYVFLLALNIFLLAAGSLMEIFAAIVFLVPLLLPVAVSYGIDPVHFGIIFLANIEMGFLCPPAGMNIYFASAMFDKPIRHIVASIVPALASIFLGAIFISCFPLLSTGLPGILAVKTP
jgi:tripartite ATP-independent transporter DctM subunit